MVPADSTFDRDIRRVLKRAEQARSGARREGDELRPLGKKASRTRAALLAAAYDCFVTKGYRATSVQDIHEAADVSLGTFYQYFREKADVVATLVGELIIQTADDLFRPLPVSGDGGGSFRAVEPFVRTYAETADFQRVWEEVTHIEDGVARIRWEVTDLIDAGLARSIAAAQRAGKVDAELDPMAAARALNSMVDRYCYRTFVVDGRRGEESVTLAVRTLATLWDVALSPPARSRSGRKRASVDKT